MKTPPYDTMLKMLDAGFKAMSKIHHPDAGGDAAVQAELSDAKATIQRLIITLRAEDQP